MTRPTKTDVEIVPVEYDSAGRPRRYEVVRSEPETIQPPEVVDISPIVSPLPPARQPGLVTVVQGSHQDRARAFGIETLQLSLVTGGLFVVASIALNGAVLPIFTLALVYFAGFAVTWLAAYLLHTLRSAEGVELYGAFRLWNFLDREQAERWKRYNVEPPRHRLATTGDRILMGLFLGTILLLCIIMILINEGVL